jgi:toxin ParE1/3/4
VSRYILSPLAVADLEAIFEYTLLTWGEEQFDRYRKALSAALESLAVDLFTRKSKARDDLMEGCRFFRVEHHFIVYRVAKERIEVGRVLHERMDFERQIGGDAFPG